jgi:hypothetical protein
MSFMARKATSGALPCLLCGRGFRTPHALTTHLDYEHADWVDTVMRRLGLSCPAEYPIQEYRLALAEAFATFAELSTDSWRFSA